MTAKPLVVALLLAAACKPVVRPDGGKGLLPVGAAVPALVARDQDGVPHQLASERGHFVVVYFYPKDSTPGCTQEACAFRDAWSRFRDAQIQVFGVSNDDTESHAEFAKDYALPFPLLADPEHVWARAFGVSTHLGMAERVTFVVDPEGKIAKVYPDVDPALHATEVLTDVATLRGGR